MYFLGGGGRGDLECKAEKCVLNWLADRESLLVFDEENDIIRAPSQDTS